MLSENDLNGIAERNREAKKLKNATSPAPWGLDGPGYVNAGSLVQTSKRMGILVRPMDWFCQLREKVAKHDLSGVDLLEQGFYSHPNHKQAYRDSAFIIGAKNGSAEDDIDVLLKEVRLLRRKLGLPAAKSDRTKLITSVTVRVLLPQDDGVAEQSKEVVQKE